MAYYTSRIYRQSRGGFLSGIGRAIGGAARAVGRVASVVPGLGAVGAVAGVVGSALGSRSAQAATMPGGLQLTGPRVQVGGGRGFALEGPTLSLAGGGGAARRPGRRMNAGNAKAARRAIRRIKSVRHLLQSIERELPRRPARRGTVGVITRREAARALAS